MINLLRKASVKSVALGYLSRPFLGDSAGPSRRHLQKHNLLLSFTYQSRFTGPVRDGKFESTYGYDFLNARQLPGQTESTARTSPLPRGSRRCAPSDRRLPEPVQSGHLHWYSEAEPDQRSLTAGDVRTSGTRSGELIFRSSSFPFRIWASNRRRIVAGHCSKFSGTAATSVLSTTARGTRALIVQSVCDRIEHLVAPATGFFDVACPQGHSNPLSGVVITVNREMHPPSPPVVPKMVI